MVTVQLLHGFDISIRIDSRYLFDLCIPMQPNSNGNTTKTTIYLPFQPEVVALAQVHFFSDCAFAFPASREEAFPTNSSVYNDWLLFNTVQDKVVCALMNP